MATLIGVGETFKDRNIISPKHSNHSMDMIEDFLIFFLSQSEFTVDMFHNLSAMNERMFSNCFVAA